MPEPARVLADMKGTNDVDTAAHQCAALLLLKTLVQVAANGTGQTPWPTRERELRDAYDRALPDVDGHRDEIMAESLQLDADPYFVQPFLSRYFSEDAVRELDPLVPRIESAARKSLLQVKVAAADVQKQSAAPVEQNQPVASPNNSIALPDKASDPGATAMPVPDKTWLTVAGISVFATVLLLVPLLPLRRFIGVSAPANIDRFGQTTQSNSPGGQADGEVGPLAAIILEKVGSLARPLEPGELVVRSGAKEMLQLRLMVQHSVKFSANTSNGKGPLPSGVTALGSLDILISTLRDRLRAAHLQAGPRIDSWAKKCVSDYRHALTPDWCMQSMDTIGVEGFCATCKGHARVMCLECRGSKRVSCDLCRGSGKVKCRCQTEQYVRCWHCEGRGYEMKPDSILTEYDRLQTIGQEGRVLREVPCGWCDASGKEKCYKCYSGMVDCDKCRGSGKIGCSHCGATGFFACKDCAATGRVHCCGEIQCGVERTGGVGVAGGNPEDQETFVERLAFDDIGQLASDTGGVVHEGGGREQLSLTHSYKASIRTESAEAKIGEQSIVIRAYGPGRAIFNYHNLVSNLLTADLARLESCVRPLSFFRSRARSALTRNINRFLASEVNARIAESLAPPAKANGNSKMALEPDRHTDVVDEQYTRRAGKALSKAMTKLYDRIMLPMLPGLAALMTLLFLFSRKNLFLSGTIGVRITVLTALMVLFWVGLEQLAKYKVKLVLDPRSFARLKKQFTIRRTWYRPIMLGIFLFAWYLSLIMVRRILHIQLGTPFDFGPEDSAQLWQ
jgi:hypothetical protein